jgi:REP element-mobilizing transposase RayT
MREGVPGIAMLQRGSNSDPPIAPARLEPGAPGVGWHSRGYLPHFDGSALIQHVTCHLSDSLPVHALERIEREIARLPDEQQAVERRKRLHAWIDAGHGRCPLRNPLAATMMEDVLLHGDGIRYHLLAWVVMPNHVHALFEPLPGWTVSRIVASWKSYAGRRLSSFGADAATGHVWHREYWDRYIRNERHHQDVVAYIHANPVVAGLCHDPTAWPWSSAARQRGPGQ